MAMPSTSSTSRVLYHIIWSEGVSVVSTYRGRVVLIPYTSSDSFVQPAPKVTNTGIKIAALTFMGVSGGKA